MKLEDARRVIADNGAKPVDLVLAAGTLVSSDDSTFEDLLACLKRGGSPASIAATALYLRTKRRRGDRPVEAFCMDFSSWHDYLRAAGILRSPEEKGDKI
jgi:hypothetical protein